MGKSKGLPRTDQNFLYFMYKLQNIIQFFREFLKVSWAFISIPLNLTHSTPVEIQKQILSVTL